MPTANNIQTPVRPDALRGTLGFIFTPELDQVLLILKNRPEFAAGKFNGIGGKHELGETDQACLSREVREETGLAIDASAWQTVAHVQWPDWDGGLLTTVWSGGLAAANSLTDEPVSWHRLDTLPKNCIPNLFWMIPLAKDVWLERMRNQDKRELYIQATYTNHSS